MRPPIILMGILTSAYVFELLLSVSARGVIPTPYFHSGLVFQLSLLFGSVMYIRKKEFSLSFKNVSRENIWDVLFLFILTIIFIFFIRFFVGHTVLSSISLVSVSALSMLVSILLAPITEEVFFRGLLLSELGDASLSSENAVILSSLLFAGGHIFSLFDQPDIYTGLLSLFFVFVSGLLFAKVYVLTNNIFIPMATHSLYNLLVI